MVRNDGYFASITIMDNPSHGSLSNTVASGTTEQDLIKHYDQIVSWHKGNPEYVAENPNARLRVDEVGIICQDCCGRGKVPRKSRRSLRFICCPSCRGKRSIQIIYVAPSTTRTDTYEVTEEERQ